jgi:UDP-N-acetyl-D-mannosaminuronic acid dehydrogenase
MLPAVLWDTDATLIDVDTAIETCLIMIVLVDHDVFKSIPLEERVDKAVLATRGIRPDQPRASSSPVSATARFESQRLAG